MNTRSGGGVRGLRQSSIQGADAQGLAELFVDDGKLIDPEGNATRGKAAIAEMYAASFKGPRLESRAQGRGNPVPDP